MLLPAFILAAGMIQRRSDISISDQRARIASLGRGAVRIANSRARAVIDLRASNCAMKAPISE